MSAIITTNKPHDSYRVMLRALNHKPPVRISAKNPLALSVKNPFKQPLKITRQDTDERGETESGQDGQQGNHGGLFLKPTSSMLFSSTYDKSLRQYLDHLMSLQRQLLHTIKLVNDGIECALSPEEIMQKAGHLERSLYSLTQPKAQAKSTQDRKVTPKLGKETQESLMSASRLMRDINKQLPKLEPHTHRTPSPFQTKLSPAAA